MRKTRTLGLAGTILLASALALTPTVANAEDLPADPSPIKAAPAQLGAMLDEDQMPWLDASKTPAQRTELLLAAMTEAEKIHMLHGASNLLGSRDINKDDPPSIGYLPAIERLRIPALVMTDGPAGLRNWEKATVMPAPITQAASFDPAIANATGRAIAADSADRGQDLLFGPGFNVARNPLAGRTFEYFGEDPYLAGVMAGENAAGLQSEGIMANLKHFVANNQETNRTLNSSNIDPRTLREIYEKPFTIAIERSNPASIMCAYNKVNGVPACGNRQTLVDDLRGYMGFDGFVVTDYPAAWAPTDIKNGLNVELPGAQWTTEKRIREAIAKGDMTWKDIDLRVGETLTQMFRFGLFDHKWDFDRHDRVRELREIPFERGNEAALNAALGGSVLLKNNGTLPLKASEYQGKRVLVVGGGAKKVLAGGGSSGGTPIKSDNALEQIQARLGAAGATVVFKSDFDPLGIAIEARRADLVIVFANQISTELIDRPNLDFLPHINNAVANVASRNSNVVVVVQAGGPVLMPWLDSVGAVLDVWYPGQAGGEATARLLFGEANPSGRLPQTFPAAEGQWPAATRDQFPGAKFGMEANYTEGVFMGYRWYTSFNHKPLFPFGYGLSYTKFDYQNFQVLSPAGSATDKVKVAVDVTNTGAYAGATVPQVYVSKPEVSGAQMPVRELAAFQKVHLQPGETQRVVMEIDPLQLAHWSTAANGFQVPAGTYQVSLGDSASDIRATKDYVVR